MGTKRRPTQAEIADSYFMAERPRIAESSVTIPGLYDVDWATLRESYGRAWFIPQYLEALVSAHEALREWGFGALHASIIHQGHPVEASPFAVPFLRWMLLHESTPDRSLVSDLLVGLAIGDPGWSLAEGIDLSRWHRTSCYEAVAAYQQDYVSLLANQETAPLVFDLCAYIESCAGAAWPHLLTLAQRTTSEGPLTSALIASGIVANRLRSGDGPWTHFLNHPSRWVAAGAAIAACFAHGHRVDASVLDSLRAIHPSRFITEPWLQRLEQLEEIEAPQTVIDAVRAEKHATAERVDMPAIAFDILVLAPAVVRTVDMPAGIDDKLQLLLTTTDRAMADRCAQLALEELFPQPLTHAPLLDDLSRRQRSVLRYYAREASQWGPNFHLTYLPFAKNWLARFLGEEAPGPLDTPSVVDGKERPLWFFLHHAVVDEKAVDAAIAAVASVRIENLSQFVADVCASIQWPVRLDGHSVNYGGANFAESSREQARRRGRYYMTVAAGLAQNDSVRSRLAAWCEDFVAACTTKRDDGWHVAAHCLRHIALSQDRPLAISNRQWLCLLDTAPASFYPESIAALLRALPRAQAKGLLSRLPIMSYTYCLNASTPVNYVTPTITDGRLSLLHIGVWPHASSLQDPTDAVVSIDVSVRVSRHFLATIYDCYYPPFADEVIAAHRQVYETFRAAWPVDKQDIAEVFPF